MSTGRYVQRYRLGQPCDHIEALLKHVALTQGRTQRVKVLTGTGGSSGVQGLRFLGIPGQLQVALTLLYPLPSAGNVNMTMLNYPAAAYEFLRDFRAGRLGRVTLD